MLDQNRLQPPPNFAQSEASIARDCGSDARGDGGVDWCGRDWMVPADYTVDYGLFASPEDYDSTGILAGVDPCESRYWWMPELHASLDGSLALCSHAAVLERPVRGNHAARRAGSRSTAAA